MKTSKNIAGYIALSVFIIFIVCMLYKGYQFRHHFAFTKGTVIKITNSGYKSSGDYSVIFEYTVNGEIYHGNNNRDYCAGQSMTKIKALLIGKQFPVVYGTQSPSGGQYF